MQLDDVKKELLPEVVSIIEEYATPTWCKQDNETTITERGIIRYKKTEFQNMGSHTENFFDTDGKKEASIDVNRKGTCIKHYKNDNKLLSSVYFNKYGQRHSCWNINGRLITWNYGRLNDPTIPIPQFSHKYDYDEIVDGDPEDEFIFDFYYGSNRLEPSYINGLLSEITVRDSETNMVVRVEHYQDGEVVRVEHYQDGEVVLP